MSQRCTTYLLALEGQQRVPCTAHLSPGGAEGRVTGQLGTQKEKRSRAVNRSISAVSSCHRYARACLSQVTVLQHLPSCARRAPWHPRPRAVPATRCQRPHDQPTGDTQKTDTTTSHHYEHLGGTPTSSLWPCLHEPSHSGPVPTRLPVSGSMESPARRRSSQTFRRAGGRSSCARRTACSSWNPGGMRPASCTQAPHTAKGHMSRWTRGDKSKHQPFETHAHTYHVAQGLGLLALGAGAALAAAFLQGDRGFVQQNKGLL